MAWVLKIINSNSSGRNETMKSTISLILFFTIIAVQAQEIDILIKNGHVYDPKNKIDAVMDVAIADGKILDVGTDLTSEDAKKVVDATGLIVSPGLIDLHTHVFVGSRKNKFANGNNSLSPDDFTFKAGITTVVDAGTSGYKNFPLFKAQVIDQTKTRVLAFLNIAAYGMTGDDQQNDHQKMEITQATETIQEYPDLIVGVKIGQLLVVLPL